MSLFDMQVDKISIKISSKFLNMKFKCSVDYIENVCHGSCCSKGNGDLLICLLPDEVEYQNNNGFKTINGKMCADEKTKRCPHQNKLGCCDLHYTGHKPTGCIVSPFKINKNNTLIIRYRYVMMKCRVKDSEVGGDFAYNVFKPSLIKIFGEEQTNEIITKLKNNVQNIVAYVDKNMYDKLNYLEKLKK